MQHLYWCILIKALLLPALPFEPFFTPSINIINIFFSFPLCSLNVASFYSQPRLEPFCLSFACCHYLHPWPPEVFSSGVWFTKARMLIKWTFPALLSRCCPVGQRDSGVPWDSGRTEPSGRRPPHPPPPEGSGDRQNCVASLLDHIPRAQRRQWSGDERHVIR